MYQYISRMPTSQVKSELAQLKRYCIAIEKAFKSKIPNNPSDKIDEFCEEMMLESKFKYEELERAAKKMEDVYEECAKFYCEDPKKQSDEVGKKMFQSVLFIFNT